MTPSTAYHDDTIIMQHILTVTYNKQERKYIFDTLIECLSHILENFDENYKYSIVANESFIP